MKILFSWILFIMFANIAFAQTNIYNTLMSEGNEYYMEGNYILAYELYKKAKEKAIEESQISLSNTKIEHCRRNILLQKENLKNTLKSSDSLSFVSQKEKQKAQSLLLLNKAIEYSSKNPTIAIQLIQEAYNISPKTMEIRRGLYSIYYNILRSKSLLYQDIVLGSNCEDFIIIKNGNKVATIESDRYIRIYDTNTGLLETKLDNKKKVEAIYLVPKKEIIIALTDDYINKIQIWDINTYELLNTYYGPEFYWFNELTLSPDNSYFTVLYHMPNNAGVNATKFILYSIETNNSRDLCQISLDASLIAFNDNSFVIGSSNNDDNSEFGKLILFKGKKTIELNAPPSGISKLAFSFNGNQIISDEMIWNAKNGKIISKEYCSNFFISEFDNLFLSHQGNLVQLKNPENGEVMKQHKIGNSIISEGFFLSKEKAVIVLKIISDGKFSHYQINSWDYENNKITVLADSIPVNFKVEFSPTKDSFIAPHDNNNLGLFDINTGKLLNNIIMPDVELVKAAKFSPKGNFIATIAENTSIKVWNIESSHLLEVIKNPDDIKQVAFNETENELLINSASFLNQLKLNNNKQIEGRGNNKYDKISKNGDLGLTTNGDLFIITDIKNNKIVAYSEKVSGLNKSLFSPDGSKLAYTIKDSLFVYDINSQKIISKKINNDISNIQFSPNGKNIGIISEITSTIYNSENDSLNLNLNGRRLLSFSSNGNMLITESGLIIDSNTGQIISNLSSSVISACFSSDGTMVLANYGKTFSLCDIKTGREIRSFIGHSDTINSIGFSPFEDIIISASDDKTVIIWDLQSGEKIYTFKEHQSVVNNAFFSETGNKIASISKSDSTIIIWPSEKSILEWIKRTNLHKITPLEYSKLGINLMNEQNVAFSNNHAKENMSHINIMTADVLDLSRGQFKIIGFDKNLNYEKILKLELSVNNFSTIPIELKKFPNLKELNLSYNNFRTLPIELKELNNLKKLDLSHNKLLYLASDIGKLGNLVQLDLSSNSLNELPSEIIMLSNLIEIDLGQNKLFSFPIKVCDIQSLEYINLSNNFIERLPSKISNLKKLKILNLSNNSLKKLTVEIGNLSNLTELDLSENLLDSLPPEFGKLQKLQKLKLGDNPIINLPSELNNLKSLKELHIAISSKTNFKQVFSVLSELPNLNYLSLYTDSLTCLPPEVGMLTNIRFLDLSHNKLSQLPAEIGKLRNLSILDISNNQVTSLPPTIGRLTNLTSLVLASNNLSELPHELSSLINLERLDLDGNEFRFINKIPYLKELNTLSIEGNYLTLSDYKEFKKFTKLEILYLSNQFTGKIPDKTINDLHNLLPEDCGISYEHKF